MMLSTPDTVEDFSGSFPFYNVLPMLVRQVASIDDVRFLQIGAADGSTDDPINELVKRHRWQGTLVEPSKRSFDRLRESYRDCQNLHFEQCLVTDTVGSTEQTLYEVVDWIRDRSTWAEQSSSMDRSVVAGFLNYFSTTSEGRDLPRDLDSLIEEISVPSIHVSELIRKLNITALDVLVIDTMGHDAKILLAFPFNVLKPRLIMFEHSAMSAKDKEAVLGALAEVGYSFVKFAVDTIAVLDKSPRQWSVTEW